MSTGLYAHTTRATGTVLTAAIYNADHQNHITNLNPAMTGALSDNLTEYRSTTDPGGSGSESLAANLAGELQRIRYVISRMVGKTYWYEAPATDFQNVGAGPDLAAIEALAGTSGLLAKIAANTWALRNLAVAGTGLSVTNPAGVAGNPTITIDPAAVVAAGGGSALVAATQAEEEAASSLTVFTSPGRQRFHPGVAKCWAYVTVAAGVPTLFAGSYNITSITDTGTGILDITIATDFSSASWAPFPSIVVTGVSNGAGVWTQSITAGSIQLRRTDGSTLTDPLAWGFAGFGDQ